MFSTQNFLMEMHKYEWLALWTSSYIFKNNYIYKHEVFL